MLQLTVDQIVKEARRPVQSTLSARCDAAATIAERVAFWSALAEDDGRRSRSTSPGPPAGPGVRERPGRPARRPHRQRVRPHPRRHRASRCCAAAPAGSTVRAHRRRRRRGLVGGAAPGPGHTGLGLDIARRTAQDCGGHLVTGTTPTGGAQVEVALPLVDLSRSVVATAAVVARHRRRPRLVVVPVVRRSSRSRRRGRVAGAGSGPSGAGAVGVRGCRRVTGAEVAGAAQRDGPRHVGDAGASDPDGGLRARRPASRPVRADDLRRAGSGRTGHLGRRDGWAGLRRRRSRHACRR